jgi:aspartate/methionine/tyrosine aminotransferase
MSDSPAMADRMGHIQPFYVMELLARARELEASGRSIIHMEVGEPDFPTPELVREAGKRALDEGYTTYTPAAGIPELRSAIARHYRDAYRVDIPPRRVVVTPGSSGALQLILGTLINPGDGVLMADPSYPCNRNFVRLVEGEPIAIPVDAQSSYQLTAEMVENAWYPGIKAVMVATPSNPTGTLLDADSLRDIADVVRSKGGALIVDEIYQGLVYGKERSSVLSVADDAFVINSFSKYFGMTGWRLGWLIAPERYIGSIDKLAQNIFLSPPSPSQYAALVALGRDNLQTLEQRRREFEQRRDYLLPRLQSLGFKIPLVPEGAFYLYADCSALTSDSYGFAMELLEQEGVAITPGRDFGDNRPEQHVRFAYTTSIERLEEGITRLARFIERRMEQA